VYRPPPPPSLGSIGIEVFTFPGYTRNRFALTMRGTISARTLIVHTNRRPRDTPIRSFPAADFVVRLIGETIHHCPLTFKTVHSRRREKHLMGPEPTVYKWTRTRLVNLCGLNQGLVDMARSTNEIIKVLHTPPKIFAKVALADTPSFRATSFAYAKGSP